MADTLVNSTPSIWKRFEKLFAVITVFGAVAAIIGVYYQLHSKKVEVQYQITSKDYLTSNNNIDRLKSNYQYAGIPVKNLWLLKFKIINTGDYTLIGKGNNGSILDTSLTFKFPDGVQIVDKPNLIQNNFPDHLLLRTDSNTLSLSFQQWRKGEFASYSIYLKADKKDILLLPTSKRLIKDGNILISDLSNDQDRDKATYLDSLLTPPWPLVCRILGILLAILIFLTVNVGILNQELKGWIKILKWRNHNYNKFVSYLNSNEFLSTDSNFYSGFKKEIFIQKKTLYINDPSKLPPNPQLWKNANVEPFPLLVSSSIVTWKSFFVFMVILFFVNLSAIAIILGLWIH